MSKQQTAIQYLEEMFRLHGNTKDTAMQIVIDLVQGTFTTDVNTGLLSEGDCFMLDRMTVIVLKKLGVKTLDIEMAEHIVDYNMLQMIEGDDGINIEFADHPEATKRIVVEFIRMLITGELQVTNSGEGFGNILMCYGTAPQSYANVESVTGENTVEEFIAMLTSGADQTGFEDDGDHPEWVVLNKVLKLLEDPEALTDIKEVAYTETDKTHNTRLYLVETCITDEGRYEVVDGSFIYGQQNKEGNQILLEDGAKLGQFTEADVLYGDLCYESMYMWSNVDESDERVYMELEDTM